MHLLMITYQLQGITEADYLAQNREDALLLATFPGLSSKVWLADAATNTYGGVYLWQDREAMEAFLHSDIVKAVAADPSRANLTVKDFAIAEDLSRVTRGIPQDAPA
jgi:antibiotic biosynthesis monooxygenase (ABM) superfamily enzyme